MRTVRKANFINLVMVGAKPENKVHDTEYEIAFDVIDSIPFLVVSKKHKSVVESLNPVVHVAWHNVNSVEFAELAEEKKPVKKSA